MSGVFAGGDLVQRQEDGTFAPVAPSELDFGLDDGGLVGSDDGQLAADATKWELDFDSGKLIVHEDVSIEFGSAAETRARVLWNSASDRLACRVECPETALGQTVADLEIGTVLAESFFRHPLLRFSPTMPAGINAGKGYLSHDVTVCDPTGASQPILRLAAQGTDLNPNNMSWLRTTSDGLIISSAGSFVFAPSVAGRVYLSNATAVQNGAAVNLSAFASFDGALHVQMLGNTSQRHGATIRLPASPHADARILRGLTNADSELWSFRSNGDWRSTRAFGVWGANAPSSQPAHIADPSGVTTDEDVEARAAIVSVLSLLESYGLVAAS